VTVLFSSLERIFSLILASANGLVCRHVMAITFSLFQIRKKWYLVMVIITTDSWLPFNSLELGVEPSNFHTGLDIYLNFYFKKYN